MGLFSNNKKLCPICGNATPRLFPRKFDDQPICKECEKKLDLPDEVLDSMNLDGFRQYLEEYQENEPQRAAFRSTYEYGASFFSSGILALDEEHGLIRLKSKPESWAIEKKYLKSFRILEDDRVLFENGNGTLNRYPSDVPARAEELIPTINAFCAERREFERREEMERLYHRGESNEERMERERINNTYRPRFEDPRLLREFCVEVTLDHAYWTFYRDISSAPAFDESAPSVEDYLENYREKVDALHTLARKLMHMIDPKAGETQVGLASSQKAFTAPSPTATRV